MREPSGEENTLWGQPPGFNFEPCVLRQRTASRSLRPLNLPSGENCTSPVGCCDFKREPGARERGAVWFCTRKSCVFLSTHRPLRDWGGVCTQAVGRRTGDAARPDP